MKKGQVWVETVIYTLIGLGIIALVLGIVKPSVEQRRDALSIQQGIGILNSIDSTVNEIKYTAGNSRGLKVRIGSGKMLIDGENDSLSLSIDSGYEYSQPGVEINAGGNVKAITISKGKKYQIKLYIDYKDRINVTYRGRAAVGTLQTSPSDYNLIISNRGLSGSLNNIDFSV